MDLLVDQIINAIKKITGRHDRLVVQILVEVVDHCKFGEGNLENSEQDYLIFFVYVLVIIVRYYSAEPCLFS